MNNNELKPGVRRVRLEQARREFLDKQYNEYLNNCEKKEVIVGDFY